MTLAPSPATEYVFDRHSKAQMIWALLKSYMLDECSFECAAVSNADEKNLINLIMNSLPTVARGGEAVCTPLATGDQQEGVAITAIPLAKIKGMALAALKCDADDAETLSEIHNYCLSLLADGVARETYTEICMNEKCPRGGKPVEVVRPPVSRPQLSTPEK